ncbi:MAG TPA: MarR family transcriptional regulator [Ferrovibrio sp.]|uniref:MarR family winged helix-turn-helix transcriptional regulator n=1 Tax=Ferrovibrio sp. TaxID=1917215 RepID=UPI002ED682D0
MTAAKPPTSHPDALHLDRYLPYLINRAGVSMAMRFGAVLRREGISLQDWRVLAALRERGGQRLTELAQRTSIEISTLSRVVGAMEAAGLVSRGRDEADARAIAIRLTAAGEALAGRLTPAAERLERHALAGLSDAEADQLKALLHRIYDNLATVPGLDGSPAGSSVSGGNGRGGNGHRRR